MKEVTIADIQNGIEKRKQRSRDAERKQQESKSAEQEITTADE